MSLNAPNLDDRTFQQLVDDMRSRIPTHCEEWTDINLSDPGITLIELFAFMGERLLYRMNQVPELHLRKFLEMLGMQRQEPTEAKAQVTFWLSKPLDKGEEKTIDNTTAVATQQSETDESIVFTVTDDFHLRRPTLSKLLVKDAGGGINDRLRYDESNSSFVEDGTDQTKSIIPFVSVPPQLGDSLYLGFADNPSNLLLHLALAVDNKRAAGGAESGDPPYVWEAYTGTSSDDGWAKCDLDIDDTQSMNRNGKIQVHVPTLQRRDEDGDDLYWVRARLTVDNRQNQDAGYAISPQINRMEVSVAGGTVHVVHAEQVSNEFLGVSDGTADQRFFLQRVPLLKRDRQLEYLCVKLPMGQTALSTATLAVNGTTSIGTENQTIEQHWSEQPDLADSTPYCMHFTLDSMTGELRLGPAVRQRDGSLKQYGKIPDAGANLYFTRYRFQGGEAGNVNAGHINTLKTSLSYVNRVSNRTPATGGQNEETIEELKLRAAKLLRTPNRGVTVEDYEYLATEGFNTECGEKKVAAARCHKPGEYPNPPKKNQNSSNEHQKIRLTILPYIQHAKSDVRSLKNVVDEAFKALVDNQDGSGQLNRFLNDRSLLTTSTEIDLVEFCYVAVHVTVHSTLSNQQNAHLRSTILAKLNQLIHPFDGGPDSNGWPIGRELRISDVYACLRAGEDGIEPRNLVEVVLFRAENATHSGIGEAKDIIEIDARSIICSAQHNVTIHRVERTI